jgi:hypothetical protein
LITANITVIIIASTRPITPTDKVGINKAIAAITDIEDYKAIIKALAIEKALTTTKEALIEDLAEVDSKIELNINKGSS